VAHNTYHGRTVALLAEVLTRSMPEDRRRNTTKLSNVKAKYSLYFDRLMAVQFGSEQIGNNIHETLLLSLCYSIEVSILLWVLASAYVPQSAASTPGGKRGVLHVMIVRRLEMRRIAPCLFTLPLPYP